MIEDNEAITETPRFVEVALPLPLRRTFTYSLPAGFRDKCGLGSRVLVPFGNRQITGYAVAFHTELDHAGEIDKDTVRDVLELIDEEPLITAEILELSRWTSDYYAASWGELLKAALPAGINKATEQIIAITEHGRDLVHRAVNAKPTRVQILRRLHEHGETTRKELDKEFGAGKVQRCLRELLADEAIEQHFRTQATAVKPKLRKAVTLMDAGRLRNGKVLTDTQDKVLSVLKNSGGEMVFSELAERSGAAASVINTLAKRGYVAIAMKEIRRDPLAELELALPPDVVLNPEQAFVFASIETALDDQKYKAFLLHGVTGSGKTEVYIRSMRSALISGRSAMMLVPEIALTPIFSRRLKSVFGDKVAILHSNLSPGERFDEWRRIRRGDASVVIGTRSAVFAPLNNLGLVIVDEEHDTSYRQNESPFYNARDIAVMRASMAGAVVVLGSATPALESFFNARNEKYHYLQLRNRIGNRPLANAELIDMRDEFRRAGKEVIISEALEEAIADTHRRGEQSIILLNRRGFSSFVLCRTCGESIKCRNCDITLTYHKIERKLSCHYCGFTAPVPHSCPLCESEFLYFIGQGTEQIESILTKKFPELRIERVDRDTVAKKGQMTKTLLAFDRGEIDMLVGTQMLAKGHDFHNVTLVGVISVDIGLGLPDFRSAERTFQLITQVAGRAGRGNLRGRVLIQTYYPEHYALKHACGQDYDGFYNEEIRFRQRLAYPPFVVLASILIKHADRERAMRSAQILKSALERANGENTCRILGVAQASIARLKNEYRFQILIKSQSRKKLRETLDIALDEAETRGADMRSIFVEIDPVNLM